MTHRRKVRSRCNAAVGSGSEDVVVSPETGLQSQAVRRGLLTQSGLREWFIRPEGQKRVAVATSADLNASNLPEDVSIDEAVSEFAARIIYAENGLEIFEPFVLGLHFLWRHRGQLAPMRTRAKRRKNVLE